MSYWFGIVTSLLLRIQYVYFFDYPHIYFPSQLGLYLVLYVLIGFFLFYVRPTRFSWYISALIFSLLLLMLYMSFSVPAGVGDSRAWIRYASTKDIWTSNVLGGLIYHWAFLKHIDLNFLPPFAGFFSALAAFFVARELRLSDQRFVFWFLVTGVHAIFFKNYVETVIWSVPFVLIYILYIIRYLRSSTRFDSSILLAGIALGLGCLAHGSVTFLTPSLPIAIFLRGIINGRKKFWWRILEFISSLAVSGVVVFSIINTVRFYGFHFVTTDMDGGPNGKFVPIHPTLAMRENIFFHFTMFSWPHLTEISNIFLLMSPIVAGVAFFVLLRMFKKQITVFKIETVWLSVLVFGVIGFISLWGFDIGYPGDYDLMVGFGYIILFWVVHLLQEFPLRRSTEQRLWLIGFFYSWHIITHILK